MKIAFLSWLSPYDIHNWSGTLFYIYKHLSKSNEVTWIGYEEVKEVKAFHKIHKSNIDFNIESYSELFGYLFNKRFSKETYDLIIARDSFMIAYLSVSIPTVFIGDTTYRLFSKYLGTFEKNLDNIEYRAFHSCSRIIVSSEWARESVINDYGINSQITEVIEFGANIEESPNSLKNNDIRSKCNLLFIGRNWDMKGGDKALQIYHSLKEDGYPCSLTCIGSSPKENLTDDNIHIYEHIDKSSREGKELFNSILERSSILIAPTLFECFGIMFCEAAAYGIPILTNNVGGVSQVVKEGSTGFLFSAQANIQEYIDKIKSLLANKSDYNKLRENAYKDYQERLNWSIWEERIEAVLRPLVFSLPDIYIPTYIINLKSRIDRRKHILKEFNGRKEFQINLVDACEHNNGRIGLWNSIVSIINEAKIKNHDLIVICEDDHFFTFHYQRRKFITQVVEAYQQGAEILSGGVGGFGRVSPVGIERYQTDWFWCTQFIVIYSNLFDKIINYQFQDEDTADGVLSKIASNKMFIYPFISEQKDFGYSDVTINNDIHKGLISRHFEYANQYLDKLTKSFRFK